MSTPRFKIGDNVVCVDNSGCETYLRVNYDYIVSDVRFGKVSIGISVVGVDNMPPYKGWRESRFVKRDTAHDEHVLVEQIKQSRTIGAQS